jgi:hypothetical protein
MPLPVLIGKAVGNVIEGAAVDAVKNPTHPISEE